MSEASHPRSKTENHIQMEQIGEKTNYFDSIALDRSTIQLYLEPPIDLTTKNYSLAPDMIGGWKPRSQTNSKTQIIIPITYEDENRDLLLKCLLRQGRQAEEKLVHLATQKMNSYELHQGRTYPNPLKKDKNLSHLQNMVDKTQLNRNKMLKNIVSNCFLKFNSDFQGGNIDFVLQKPNLQFDVYMRVDTNTRGHTNWYFFQVCNNDYQGQIHFNICNFRRQTSLYQKGVKPYILSEKEGGQWKQQGKNINYGKSKSKYSFLSTEEKDLIFSKYFVLSFDYQFKHTHDTVKFAYCVPYLYSQLMDFLQNLKQVQRLPSLKSLSGLSIPVLKVGDDKNYQSKKVALITGRVHPGQSNSSYVMQGFLSNLCNKNSVLSSELKHKYIFYIVPMVNPDGVVAGNYRTSLFGKDLNRTYNQSRKHAFPQTFYILQLALKLKAEYKSRFNLFIDLHGHSSKKNVFMYGPEFSIQTMNYDLCRQLPKIMSNLTNHFRFYSCSFRISNHKQSTARGIFNKVLNIPFTYTLEISNGLFFDSDTQNQTYGNKQLWNQIGLLLCKALNTLKLQKPKLIKRILSEKHPEKTKTQPQQKAKVQDEKTNQEEDSDYDPIEEDLPAEFFVKLQNSLDEQRSQKDKSGKHQQVSQRYKMPPINQPKTIRKAFESKLTGDQLKKLHDLSRQVEKNVQLKIRRQFMLPPVLQLNKNQIFIPRKISEQIYKKRDRSSKNAHHTIEIKETIQKRMCPTIIVHEPNQAYLQQISRSRSMGKPTNDFFTILQKFRPIK